MFPLLPRFDVTVVTIVSGQLVSNVLHWSAPAAAPTAPQMQAAADALSTRFGAKYKAFLGTSSRYEGVELRYLSATAGRYHVSTVAAGNGVVLPAGGAAGPAGTVPAGAAVIVQKLGDGPPKRANGTMFLGGFEEGYITDGRLTTAGVELAQSVGFETTVEMTTAGAEGTACNLSRTSLLLYAIIGINALDVLGHLRRRRPRR
jgi:hypothetical protein